MDKFKNIYLQRQQAIKCSTYDYWSKLANCRFKDLASLKAGNLILYVGANTDGADGVELMKKCPHWWAKQKSQQTLDFERTFAASFTFMSQFHHSTKYSKRSGMNIKLKIAGMPPFTSLV